MAFPTLLYMSENWTLIKSQPSRVQAAEIRFLSHVPGYTLRDRKRNVDVFGFIAKFAGTEYYDYT